MYGAPRSLHDIASAVMEDLFEALLYPPSCTDII